MIVHTTPPHSASARTPTKCCNTHTHDMAMGHKTAKTLPLTPCGLHTLACPCIIPIPIQHHPTKSIPNHLCVVSARCVCVRRWYDDGGGFLRRCVCVCVLRRECLTSSCSGCGITYLLCTLNGSRYNTLVYSVCVWSWRNVRPIDAHTHTHVRTTCVPLHVNIILNSPGHLPTLGGHPNHSGV